MTRQTGIAAITARDQLQKSFPRGRHPAATGGIARACYRRRGRDH